MGQRGKTSLAVRGYTALDGRATATKPFKFTPGRTRYGDHMMQDLIEGAETTWWTARSRNSVSHLSRLFANGNLPCWLYERMGAMYTVGRTAKGEHLVCLQLSDVDERATDEELYLELCLTEAGIFLEEMVSPPEEALLSKLTGH